MPSTKNPFAGRDVSVKAVRVGAKYAFWNLLDHASRLGITRLACFPLIASILGSQEFGEFVIAAAFGAILGGAIANGFSNYLIRSLAKLEGANRKAAIRYSVGASWISTVAVFGVLFFFLPVLGEKFSGNQFRFWLTAFALHYIFANPAETLLAVSRIERDFRQLAVAHFLGAIALLAAVTISPVVGRWAIAGGIVCWGLVPLVLTQRLYPRSMLRQGAVNRRELVATVIAFSTAAVVQLSTGYLDRIVLALYWPPDDVAAFFAAISLGLLFQTPALIASTLLLSLMGGIRDSSRFSKRFCLYFFAGVIFASLIVIAIGTPLGVYILSFLYPGQVEKALQIWDYAVMTAAGLTAISLLRPFSTKFSSAFVAPAISIVSLAVRAMLLFAYVPNGGLEGAAYGLVIGTLVTAILWAGAFFYFVFARIETGNES